MGIRAANKEFKVNDLHKSCLEKLQMTKSKEFR